MSIRAVFFPTFSLVCSVLCPLLLSCSSSTGPNSDTGSRRERIVVSGVIREDTVWESEKKCYVTGDVTVEVGATLTIQPEVVVKCAHARADE